MNKVLRIVSIVSGILVLCAVPFIAAASPGTPTATVQCVAGGTQTNAQARVDFSNITGTGAAGFTIVFTLPDAGVTAATGSCASAGAFATLPGCTTFSCSVVNRGSGNYSIEGVCSDGNPSNLMGSVQGPTINLANSGTAGTKTVDLLTNAGAVVSEIFDAAGDSSVFTNDRLIDGVAGFGVSCVPTAVSMTGFEANNVIPATVSAWPLMLGGVTIAAGAAFVFLRRKR